MSWIKRVEAILDTLKGSSVSEIELIEGDLEIILRRSPDHVVSVQALPPTNGRREKVPVSDKPSLAVEAPLTGVYYAAPSPTAAPFVSVGDLIQIGQTVALIEAMKVFSEIPSDVTGRVVAIQAQGGSVVKKGDVLLRVESV